MEIIDPVSGKVVASVKTATDELAASESGEMSVEFEVPRFIAVSASSGLCPFVKTFRR